MNRKELKKFREYYRTHGKINKPGEDLRGEQIKEQTDWVWFDRETIENALKDADKDGKVGGLKMYFGQYDEETIEMIPEDRPKREAYIGRISLVLKPCNLTEDGLIDVKLKTDSPLSENDEDEEDEDGWNGGRICPPDC
ncbi:hypothetical protein MM236_11085 [Belliella sp. DSM 107340]|uniref:Uncharacterized protein n=1 Tax=Belliella calami TaxID=2923436 RepID=A0ABS9UQ01_9BACT|nr:hypothetical protein [Belliella calami]MCH7398539.1 hypothetical protein [Belliella calami]